MARPDFLPFAAYVCLCCYPLLAGVAGLLPPVTTLASSLLQTVVAVVGIVAADKVYSMVDWPMISLAGCGLVYRRDAVLRSVLGLGSPFEMSKAAEKAS